MTEPVTGSTREVATTFLKVGATAYGGPAILGVMQAETQERRQWISKPRFLEGVALVNVLPGATMVQLAIFLGYQRTGWWGGLLAGLCFTAPAFVVMLALTATYAAFGVNPILSSALYGLGPIVLALFGAAVYRLGKNALRTRTHALIAVAAAAIALPGSLGVAAILAAAGGVGLVLFHSKRTGAIVLAVLALALLVLPLVPWSPLPATGAATPTLGRVASVFATLGAFTFGGGLSIIALMQEQVVDRLHWLTPREFVDGLALGQLMPGPIIMVAAYVGYKTLGVAGAAVAAAASFLPSFVMMLALMPVFERVRNLAWARAAIQGIVPSVIGVMAVTLVRLAPHAAPDAPAIVVLLVALVVLVARPISSFKAIGGGAVFGVLRDRVLVWVR
ncbi:MAG TPA: chromate efflux transporter [Methylomirabilota bacterium]|jgi:chromate transporter|nr:chromate efflux transporter [Methylomirabilota bacterium]